MFGFNLGGFPGFNMQGMHGHGDDEDGTHLLNQNLKETPITPDSMKS